MQDAMIEGAPEPPAAPALQECGWFGSSHELREGLEVMELPLGLLAGACVAAEAQAAGTAG